MSEPRADEYQLRIKLVERALEIAAARMKGSLNDFDAAPFDEAVLALADELRRPASCYACGHELPPDHPAGHFLPVGNMPIASAKYVGSTTERALRDADARPLDEGVIRRLRALRMTSPVSLCLDTSLPGHGTGCMCGSRYLQRADAAGASST